MAKRRGGSFLARHWLGPGVFGVTTPKGLALQKQWRWRAGLRNKGWANVMGAGQTWAWGQGAGPVMKGPGLGACGEEGPGHGGFLKLSGKTHSETKIT